MTMQDYLYSIIALLHAVAQSFLADSHVYDRIQNGWCGDLEASCFMQAPCLTGEGREQHTAP